MIPFDNERLIAKQMHNLRQEYPSYQATSVPFVFQIPGHWREVKVRHVVDMRVSNVDKNSMESEFPVTLCNYVDVYKNERITGSLKFMKATATSDEISRFKLKLEDVVITKDSEDWLDIGVPALVDYEADDFVCAYHLAILRPAKETLYGPFLFRCFQTRIVGDQLSIEAKGVTRYGLGRSSILNTLIPLPPPSEQAAIVKYLDHMTRRIDKAIRAKKKLIQLLNEQKQVIIHQAVTKGLDPNVPMKDSGVPWLGMVPAHWEVRKIKHICSLRSGESITSLEIEENGSFPVYGGNGLRGYCEGYTHDGSFVLIGRQGALCGNVNYASGKFWASEHAVVARPLTPIATFWFGELMRAMDLNQYSIAAAQPGLAVERIQNLQIPFPPLSEQVEIAEFLSGNLAGLEQKQESLLSAQKLYEEYRTRLIADVVTGQIDVREISAQLPDEQEDAEPFDLDDVEEEILETEQEE